MPDSQSKILWNGSVIDESEFHLMPNADWLRFAPGFFESIKASNGIIGFWPDHYERLKRGAAYWKVVLPPADQLQSELKSLLNSGEEQSGKLRLQFCVNIADSSLDYLATLEPGMPGYSLNETGWDIGVYKEQFKLISEDSNHKSNRRDIYLLASQWKIGKSFDDALIINQSGHLADSTISNVFWREGTNWFTPSLHSACIPGIMRNLILNQSKEWNMNIIESDVFPSRLMKADELFLTNVIRGIRWVKALYDDQSVHHMGNSKTKIVFEHLNSWEQEQYKPRTVK